MREYRNLVLKLRQGAKNIWQKRVAVTPGRGYIFLIMILPDFPVRMNDGAIPMWAV